MIFMKTYCKPKHTDISNQDFNRPAVHDAFGNGKLRRFDFRRYLVQVGGISFETLNGERLAHRCNHIVDAIDKVCDDMTQRIRDHDLRLPPVRQFRRVDGISRKVRDLCQESPEQQVAEYILVYALMPLFRAKLLPCQFGSIPGRGQVSGKRRIERIIRRRILGRADAIQCDVYHAYPSASTDCVMALLRRDIGKNGELLWLAQAVMDNYPGGALLIGGYFSTWAFNYVMSYLLRYIFAQGRMRRGKWIRTIQGAACYADDFVLFGKKSALLKACKRATRWSADKLGLHIKSCWHVVPLASFEDEKAARESHQRTPGVDMMGYVVRRTYTTVRGRIFVRIRRQLLRAGRELNQLGFVPWWRAQTLTSYGGWIRYSDSRRFCESCGYDRIRAAGRLSLSRHFKEAIE